MAIDKVNNDNSNVKSLDQLEKEFGVVSDKIRNALSANKDSRQGMSLEAQGQLRTLYSKAAMLAKSISALKVLPDDKKKWLDNYQSLLDKAVLYGSVARGTVPKTKLEDVKGLSEVKKLVQSFIFMSDNSYLRKYYKIESSLGLMMYGAPGTGKTMFAEAIANAKNLPLFVVTPADIFKSYVGQSEQSVKLLFQEIDACEDGAILFIDECESIFSKRQGDDKDYKASVTTELLQRINGFGGDGSKRILIAATNRPDEIDPAYLRYKRFSYLVHITPPDTDSIQAIITSKLDGIELAPDVDISKIMQMVKARTHKTVTLDCGETEEKQMYFYSAADICGIIEETCRIALGIIQDSNQKDVVPIPLTLDMFIKAFSKIPPSISRELFDTYDNFRNNINDGGQAKNDEDDLSDDFIKKIRAILQ